MIVQKQVILYCTETVYWCDKYVISGLRRLYGYCSSLHVDHDVGKSM